MEPKRFAAVFQKETPTLLMWLEELSARRHRSDFNWSTSSSNAASCTMHLVEFCRKFDVAHNLVDDLLA